MHTNTPLEVVIDTVGNNPDICLNAANYGIVADIPGGPKEVRLANARRLAACWNACLPIPTSALLAGAVAQLMEACEAIDSEIGFYAQMSDTSRNLLRAALSLVRGTPTTEG